MRALLALAASFLLPLAAAGAQPAGGERYVPAQGWDDSWKASFYERWFGRHLRAMGEPVLARRDDLGRFRSRFRMLVLPNSFPAWAVRVDERSAGGAVVTFTELDGAGGYAPGRVARRHRTTIGQDDMAALEDELRRGRFGDLSMSAPSPAQEQCADDSCTINLCIHATMYVFERLDRSGRTFVQRDSCELPPELGRVLALLAPLRERD